MKYLILILALLFIVLNGRAEENEYDFCGRTQEEALEDNANNIVCANPSYDSCDGKPAINNEQETICLEITSEQFLETYKRSN